MTLLYLVHLLLIQLLSLFCKKLVAMTHPLIGLLSLFYYLLLAFFCFCLLCRIQFQSPMLLFLYFSYMLPILPQSHNTLHFLICSSFLGLPSIYDTTNSSEYLRICGITNSLGCLYICGTNSSFECLHVCGSTSFLECLHVCGAIVIMIIFIQIIASIITSVVCFHFFSAFPSLLKISIG